MFDVKKILSNNKITIAIIILAILLVFLPITYSKFLSNAVSNSDIDTAFYILKEDYYSYQIHLEDIVPRDEVYVYNFSIANNDGTNRLETNMEYDLEIVTTTNLPLSYALYKNEEYDDADSTSIITDDVIARDGEGEDDAYFRTLSTTTETFGFVNNEENEYQLVVSFPSIYKDIKYQDVIEGISINIHSRQVLDEFTE